MPKLNFSPLPDADFSPSLDWDEAQKHKSEIHGCIFQKISKGKNEGY